MTFDLAAARFLHDRDPEAPHACATCRDRTGLGFEWPCPTATALGATGRSEWLTPTHSDTPGAGLMIVPKIIESAPHPERITGRCGSPSPAATPCNRPQHHEGPHAGGTITHYPGTPMWQWSTDPCPIQPPTGLPGPGWHCTFNRGHDGECELHGAINLNRCETPKEGTRATCWLHEQHSGDCRNANGIPYNNKDPRCTSTSPDGHRCQRDTGHINTYEALHRNEHRYWPEHPCPRHDPRTQCCYMIGHSGFCFITTNDAPPCTFKRNHMPCALPNLHAGPHHAFNGTPIESPELTTGPICETTEGGDEFGVDRCTTTSGTLTCHMDNNHTGPHANPDGTRWGLLECPIISPGGLYCELGDAVHPAGLHANGTDFRWPTRSCPSTIHDDDRMRRCILTDHHVGTHYYGPDGVDTHRCNATDDPGGSYCALAKDHHGNHTTYHGRDFGSACGATEGGDERYPCTRTRYHEGPHRDADGDEFGVN